MRHRETPTTCALSPSAPPPRRALPPAHPLARRLAVALAVALALPLAALSGCGSAPKGEGGAALCARAVALVKRRVGPEFGKALQQLPLPLSPTEFGCAVTFTRVDEEMPGEVQGEYGGGGASHELALALSDAQGQLAVTLPPTPLYREAAVRLELSLLEVRGEGTMELVVKEASSQPSVRYQGLRIFAFAAGVPTPREIFSEEVLIKTPEGIKIQPQWSVEPFEGSKALIFKGGGEFMVFVWHEGMQRLQHDLAASLRIKERGVPSAPRPAALPRPTPAAPKAPSTP